MNLHFIHKFPLEFTFSQVLHCAQLHITIPETSTSYMTDETAEIYMYSAILFHGQVLCSFRYQNLMFTDVRFSISGYFSCERTNLFGVHKLYRRAV